MEVKKADYLAKDAPKIFTDSLVDTGFAVLTNHPIPRDLIDTVYSDWQKFFNSDSKIDYLFNKETQSGYFPFRSENAKGRSQKDLKEFFHVYPQTKLPLQMKQHTSELRDRLLEIGGTMLTWIESHSPESVRKLYSMPLHKMAENSEKNLFRIIHYPPVDETLETGAIRAAAHEDIDLLTLLIASTAMGLQVKDSKGDWHNVPGEYGDIVVNVGDMLQMASDGYYKSTTHQVVNPDGEDRSKSRYSMPLFVHPRPEVQLSSSMTAEDFLNERLAEIGLM